MAKIVDFSLVECDQILFESTSLQSYGYGIVSQLPMKDRELSIQAKGVYAYLVSCAGNDKQTYPTKEKMCYDLGIKKGETLTKYIRQIQARGYIKIVKTKKGNLHYRNVYLIATDTRSIEIWKREFEEGKEIEEAEIITENKKSLTYGEVKDNDKSNNFINDSIPQDKENIQSSDSNGAEENISNNVEDIEDIRDVAYARCLLEYEGFENFDSMRKDFFINVMINKICREID